MYGISELVPDGVVQMYKIPSTWVMVHQPTKKRTKRGTMADTHEKKTVCPKRKFISCSSKWARWDIKCLKQKCRTGFANTSTFKGIYNGWDWTVRTIAFTKINSNPLICFEKDFSSRSLIGLPPPT